MFLGNILEAPLTSPFQNNGRFLKVDVEATLLARFFLYLARGIECYMLDPYIINTRLSAVFLASSALESQVIYAV